MFFKIYYLIVPVLIDLVSTHLFISAIFVYFTLTRAIIFNNLSQNNVIFSKRSGFYHNSCDVSHYSFIRGFVDNGSRVIHDNYYNKLLKRKKVNIKPVFLTELSSYNCNNSSSLGKTTIATIIKHLNTFNNNDKNDIIDKSCSSNDIEFVDSGVFTVPSLIKIVGWVQNIRKIRDGNILFVDVNDGTTVNNLQVILNIASLSLPGLSLERGNGISVTGSLDWRRGIPSQKSRLDVDLYVDDYGSGHEVIIYENGPAEINNPVIPSTKYSLEYLRAFPHLRSRYGVISSIFRIRSRLIEFTHEIFKDKRYTCVTTPLLTSVDCEGLGELFTVNVDMDEQYEDSTSNKNQSYLSVSGQLELEALCCSLGNVWKFGPSFRADRSDTPRHLSEFWMIEVELLDTKIEEMILLIQEYIQRCAKTLLNDCTGDVAYLDTHNDNDYKNSLLQMSNTKIEILSYSNAIEILNKLSVDDPTCEHPRIEWGANLSASHERSLTKYYHGNLLAIKNYPKQNRPFYMSSSDDNTVDNFDILAPIVNEIAGGSIREVNYDKLLKNMRQHNISGEEYDRYIQLRKFGNIPHGGFGIGFERLLMLMTKMKNIKDVIPFPNIRNKHSPH